MAILDGLVSDRHGHSDLLQTIEMRCFTIPKQQCKTLFLKLMTVDPTHVDVPERYVSSFEGVNQNDVLFQEELGSYVI